MKVFLGGTCNESTWRDRLVPLLNVDYFNPVVEDWTPGCMAEEIKQRKTCDIVLYTITPKMTGAYAIAEAVDDSNKRPDKTIFIVLREDHGLWFDTSQWKSLEAVTKMIADNGGKVFDSLNAAAKYINKKE